MNESLNQVLFFPFISRPNAGKGTQTTLLSQRLDLPRIDMGSLLRDIAKENSTLGQSVQSRLAQGQLVELDTVMNVLIDGLQKQLKARQTHSALGFILDGFPRNLAQAESLLALCERTGATIASAIYLEVPIDVIVERAANRRICEQCGTIYNLTSQPPTQAGICDVCGSDRLIQRVDDQPEKVQARLQSFDEDTRPVIDLLETRQLVTHVDGNRAVEQVYQDLAQIIEVSLNRYAGLSATLSV